MARVFVSHAGSDRELAEEVFGWLAANGHEMFYDQDSESGLAIGDAWQPRLFERLRWADAVVCLVTTAYVRSVFCTAELTTAMNRGSLVLPVLAEAGVRHPLLKGIQYANYVTDPSRARALLTERLRTIDASGGRGWADGRNPYPGLSAFDTDMHRVFFGRRTEVLELAKSLRSPAERADHGLLVVTGPSGCGKSSLVRAGLLPLMSEEEGWMTLPAILPGADPPSTLAGEIARKAKQLGLDWDLPNVRSRLLNRPADLIDELLLNAAASELPRRLLLVIDQLEELLTRTPSGTLLEVARLLRAIMDGPAQVIATLRPEYLAPLLASHELSNLAIRTFTLRPLTVGALPAVIRGPADLAGIEVDSELVNILVADTGSGDALPLLAFTLQQLAAEVTRGGRLSSDLYQRMGGVQGALTSQADLALVEATAATGRTPEQVMGSLLRLVTVKEQDQPARIRVPLDGLAELVRVELAAFTTRRLLTTSTENESVVIGVAHEAFLSAWPPLTHAIQNHSAALRMRSAVQQAATEWEESGRRRDKLWERGQLAAGLNDLDDRAGRPPSKTPGPDPARRVFPRFRRFRDGSVDLSPLARDFLRASVRADRLRLTRATTVLSVLLIGALTAAVIAHFQQQAAQQQQRVATARQLMAEADAARSADPIGAMTLDLAAHQIHSDGQTEAGLMNAVLGSHLKYGLTKKDGPAVHSVAWSKDGQLLATAIGNSVVLWNANDPVRPHRIGEPLIRPSASESNGAGLTAPTNAVQAAAFSPDARTLATGNSDGTVVLWDLTDPTRPKPLALQKLGTDLSVSVQSLSYSPDGRILAIGSGGIRGPGQLTLWNVADPARPVPAAEPLSAHTRWVTTVAFSPDGSSLVTGAADGTVILWDLTDPARAAPRGEPVTADTTAIEAAAFSPDGHTLATGGLGESLALWDVNDPANPRRIAQAAPEGSKAVWSLAFSPDGRTLATGSYEGPVTMWNVVDPTQPTPIDEPLAGHTRTVLSAAFTPDGTTLITGSADGTTIAWNVVDPTKSRPISQPLSGYTDAVWSLAFSPDGETLATGDVNGVALLWKLSDLTHPTPFGTPGAGGSYWDYSMKFSPDGRVLAVGSGDKAVTLWNVTDPTNPNRIGRPLTAHTSWVSTVAFSPDGRVLASGSADKTSILWDVSDPTKPSRIGQPLENSAGGVSSVAFSPDGRTLAAGSTDNSITLWDVSDPNRPAQIGQQLTGHTGSVQSVAFSPDGHTLASGSQDSTVILWDVTDPTKVNRIGEPLTGHTDWVTSVAFSPDGRTLAASSEDKTIMLWDLTETSAPTPLGRPITGHTQGVWPIAFSPDGRTLATGSKDKTVMLWSLGGILDLRDHLVDRVCSITGQALTPEEWIRHIGAIPYEDACTTP